VADDLQSDGEAFFRLVARDIAFAILDHRHRQYSEETLDLVAQGLIERWAMTERSFSFSIGNGLHDRE
jgi:hypothetical protein